MGILSELKTDNEIQDSGDSLGGQFGAVDSGLYNFTIGAAYINTSKTGALGLVLECKTKDDKTVRETFWIQSGKEKGNKNYYIDRKGDKQYLPGFNQANALCLLAVGKELSKLDTEEKIIDLYDPAAKTQVPTKVDMIVALVGQSINAGIIKQTVNKRKKDPATGNYVAVTETREENEFNKLFRAKDNLTVTEIKAGITEAVFYKKWAAKWNGVVRDRTDKKAVNAATLETSGTTPNEAELFA